MRYFHDYGWCHHDFGMGFPIITCLEAELAMTRTEEILIQRFGVLLSLEQCAELLDRSVEGLRVTLCGNNDLANKIRPAKVKLGRRVMFKATELARVLDGGQ